MAQKHLRAFCTIPTSVGWLPKSVTRADSRLDILVIIRSCHEMLPPKPDSPASIVKTCYYRSNKRAVAATRSIGNGIIASIGHRVFSKT